MRKFVYGTTYCRSCGHDVALNALICPNCGNHRPGQWDVNGIKSAGGLIVVIGIAVMGFLPLLPILLVIAIGIGIPFLIARAIHGDTGQQRTAPYSCLRCKSGMWSSNGVCPSCGFGANEMVCPCGLEVVQPQAGAFETTGVICPNCHNILRR
ncbi:MAG: hypothetical protein H6822_22365 [Planctomycetaceae bacterium]|nr:hypothetical protein [Planctomycetaceae bacterium]